MLSSRSRTMDVPAGTGSQVRASVVGALRRADVVMPADRPVALLISPLTDLVGVAGDGSCGLYTDDGGALDPERSLAEAGVANGVVLRLLTASTAPLEPAVGDLVEEMETDVRHRAASQHLWRPWIMTVAGAVLVAASPASSVWAVLTGAGGLAVALSLVGALWDKAPLAWMGGAAAAGLVCAAVAASWWTRGAPIVATSVVALSVVAVGILPAAGLRGAGVLAMDAAVARGADVGRLEASRAVDAGHAILLGGLLVCGTTMVVASCATGSWAAGDPWATAVLGAAWVIWACRARHFPGVAQQLVVTAAAVAGLLGWSATWSSQHPSLLPWVGAAYAAAGVLTVALASSRPVPLTHALARRWAGRAEAVCVLALVPLLLGQGRVYSDLLASWG